MLQGLAATGQLQDLTKQWDDAVAAGEINDDLRPYYSYNGKVYAVPFVQSYWVTFYSKTAFEKAGIDAPPTTWSDLESDLGKLKGIGEQYCTGQSEGWPSFVPFQTFVGAVSPDFYTKLTENKATFDDPGGQAGADDLAEVDQERLDDLGRHEDLRLPRSDEGRQGGHGPDRNLGQRPLQDRRASRTPSTAPSSPRR